MSIPKLGLAMQLSVMFAGGGWELGLMRCAQDLTIYLTGGGGPDFILEKYKLAKLQGIGTNVHEF